MTVLLMTAAALATALGVSKATVLRRAREGVIPVHRLGAKAIRFVLAEVLDATADRPVQATPHPKVTQLSPEVSDFFYGRQARRAGRTSTERRKAARGD